MLTLLSLGRLHGVDSGQNMYLNRQLGYSFFICYLLYQTPNTRSRTFFHLINFNKINETKRAPVTKVSCKMSVMELYAGLDLHSKNTCIAIMYEAFNCVLKDVLN